MITSNQTIQTLRAHGLRLTRQRRLVLEILEHSREHLEAQDILQRAQAQDASISLATVYRSLELLTKMGLVQENRLGEGHSHYEATPTTPHQHFVCSSCGQVIEFQAPQIVEAVEKLCLELGIQAIQVDFHVSGHCAGCLNNGSGTGKHEANIAGRIKV